MLCECVCFPVINLRSLLLLYDTVYLALPIENFLDEFLEMQGMKKKELVQLVSMGKVVLLLGMMRRGMIGRLFWMLTKSHRIL